LSPPASSGDADIIWKIIQPIVTTAVSAAVAWFTASRVAVKKVKKDAYRDLLERLDNLQEATESLYLVSGGTSEAHVLYRQVCRESDRLGIRLNEFFSEYRSGASLAGRDPVPVRVSDALFALRDIATADELAAEGRLAYIGTDPKFGQLQELVSAFRRELRAEASDMQSDHLQP
jgi:hypothetical protein